MDNNNYGTEQQENIQKPFFATWGIRLKNGLQLEANNSTAGPSLCCEVPLKGDRYLMIQVFCGKTDVMIDEHGHDGRIHTDIRVDHFGHARKLIYTSLGPQYGPEVAGLTEGMLMEEYIGMTSKKAKMITDVVEFFRPHARRD